MIVTDSHGASSVATAQVNVLPNRPPTANPGSDQTVSEGDTVHLSGSGTDLDNNTLTFQWTQFSGPSVNLSDPTDPNATFTAPDVLCQRGVVVMTLTVDDGYGGTDSKNVNINVANVNHNPTANAGGNQQVNEGQPVNLNGTGTDADKEEVATLTLQWTQTSGPTVTLSGSAKDVSFTAPTISGGDPGAYVELGFRLTVTDSCGGSGTHDITVHVANVPHAPVAVVTANPTSANEGGDTVQLDGSASYDPDGDPFTYGWTQISGPTVTLDDPSSAKPSFATPWVSADAQVKFKLTVTDVYGLHSSACVTVTIVNWNTPPDVSGAHADVGVLWPPDQRLVPVHILGVVDKQNNASITITNVTQDEPTNGLGDGDTPVDAFINGDSVLLRAERSGRGNGRVYHVHFTASDPETTALGTSPTGVVIVTVPHDKKTDIAGDGGELYDSTH